jgi:hypothetical protein
MPRFAAEYGKDILKSSMEVKQRLDSTNYEDKASGDWSPVERYHYIYDSKGVMQEEIWYYKDNNPDRDVYTYDANGNVILIMSYEGFFGNWIEDWKTEYFYDTEGNLIERLSSEKDEISKGWNPRGKITYSYNENGLLIQELAYYWGEDDWVNIKKYDYYYDEDLALMEFLMSEWDEWEEEWEYFSKTNYYYTDDLLTESIGYSYFEDSWQLAGKTEYTYDTHGNMILKTGSGFYENDWHYSTKTEYQFDNSYNFEDLILPPIFGFDLYESDKFKHKIIGWLWYPSYNVENNQWGDPYHKGNYFYSEQNVQDIDDNELTNIKVHPIPAKDYLTIDTDNKLGPVTFMIYDMSGRLVSKHLLESSLTIRVKDLQEGLYVYKIITSDVIYPGKMIIAK